MPRQKPIGWSRTKTASREELMRAAAIAAGALMLLCSMGVMAHAQDNKDNGEKESRALPRDDLRSDVQSRLPRSRSRRSAVEAAARRQQCLTGTYAISGSAPASWKAPMPSCRATSPTPTG
ncbi:MAG: hypothetical protein MZV49_22725 [Rhodopseudomonas palustris]|nr:hypothetical protein [Rhodopseudomonas palustris]